MEIKFNHVSFSYGSKEVLSDIDIVIPKSKITGIVGKSGSGKTTLIQLINGLLLPTSGSVEVGSFVLEPNKKINNINALRFDVGMVFQFPEEQFFHTTVSKEIGFGLEQFNYKRDKKDERIRESLKMVGLNDSYLERDPFSLSNGEKRKIAIASILIFNPKVIIFDEPTIGLDFESKKSFIRLVKLLKKRYNKTIIISSHDTDFLHSLVDNVIVLNKGKVVLSGDKYEVFKQEKRLRKYGVLAPKLISFSNKVLEKKKIKIGYRDEINDLIKDIYRYVK